MYFLITFSCHYTSVDYQIHVMQARPNNDRTPNAEEKQI